MSKLGGARRQLTGKIGADPDTSVMSGSRRQLTGKIGGGGDAYRSRRRERKLTEKIGRQKVEVRRTRSYEPRRGGGARRGVSKFAGGESAAVSNPRNGIQDYSSGTRLASKIARESRPVPKPRRGNRLAGIGKQIAGGVGGPGTRLNRFQSMNRMRWIAKRNPAAKKQQRNAFMRPSSKFDRHKPGNPFATKSSNLSNFAYVYKCGRIPCRINHGSVRHRLQWDVDPTTLAYDPLLLHVAEGLSETQHPYVFIASRSFKELLEAKGAVEKAKPLTKKLAFLLRNSLRSRDSGVFSRALDAFQQLSKAVGKELDPYLASIVVQINKKNKFAALAHKIDETLEEFVSNGGREAVRIIKAKVPTFVSF